MASSAIAMADHTRKLSATTSLHRWLTTCFGLALIACARCPAAPASTPPSKGAQGVATAVAGVDGPRIEALKQRVTILLEDAIGFWLKHGRDEQFGGFHGTLNRFGEPIEPTHKGLVQQARHLWTFSAYYWRVPEADVARRAAVKERADELFRFIVQHFLDPTDNEFYLRVDRQGNPTDRDKHLYSNSFAIYGLAEYAQGFDSEQARQLALACFRSIDKSCHDAQFGGYDQTQRPNWLSRGAAKDTNTHIHLMESFTNLYRATKDRQVWPRADELVNLVLTKHVQPSHQMHSEFARDFTPIGAPTISYGHDIETAWLLFDTIAALGLKDQDSLYERAFQLGSNAARLGFDPKLGGFFEEGIPNGPATKLEKIWWIQAEAIAGLYRLYQYKRDPKLLDKLEQTIAFVEKYQRDPNQGEWYWSVLPDGSLGQHRDNKSEEWKSSYHLIRALLFTRAWMSEQRVPALVGLEQGQTPPESGG
jgi:cellobiose epimerase